MSEDEGVEVRGVVALNGRGVVCFFSHSRADGVPLSDKRAMRKAVDAVPRRVTHEQMAALDPEPWR